MENVMVKMETRFFITCPNESCSDQSEEHDVDSYENSEFKCPNCHETFSYHSEPQYCLAV